MRSRKLCSNMFFWCVFVTVSVCVSVMILCMNVYENKCFPSSMTKSSCVCVCVSERERETYLCLYYIRRCIFAKLFRVLCKTDFSIPSNVAILYEEGMFFRKRDRPPVGHQRCNQSPHTVNTISSCYWHSCAHSGRPLGKQNIARSYVEQKVKSRRML